MHYCGETHIIKGETKYYTIRTGLVEVENIIYYRRFFEGAFYITRYKKKNVTDPRHGSMIYKNKKTI